VANVISRALATVQRAIGIEGQYRPGPWMLPVSGAWLPANVGNNLNWWQDGYTPGGGYTPSALVEACVSAYAQTVAMCPGDHWVKHDNGGRERIMTSDLSRILRGPNAYQTISDFLLNGTRDLYLDGNCYALALRNNRFEISELHLMKPRQCSAQVAYNGEVFYHLGGNIVVDKLLPEYPLIVPERDVLHIRLNTSYNMLRGDSPLNAIARDMALTDAVAAQQIRFYLNQARPSTVLMTDMILDKDQVAALRDRWNEQSSGLNAGGTAVLTAGLKAQAIATTPEQSQLADVLKLSDQKIALAYRIPLQMFGLGGAPLGSTEALMQSWIASGLGFCLNHIEEAFGKLFQLDGVPTEYLEFDTSALLRSDFKTRIEAMARAVTSGIQAPNEARDEFDLPEKPFGGEPRMQQQQVPLSAAAAIPGVIGGSVPAEHVMSASKTPVPPAPPAPPAPSKPAQKDFAYDSRERGLRIARSLLSTANGHDRRNNI